MAVRGERSKRGIGGWLWLGVKFMAGLFVSIHVYALLLFFVPVPATMNMAVRTVQGYELRRDWILIEDVSPHLIRAVIAAEDTKFCAHRGVDVGAIQKALDEHRQTGRLRGASTITQQTAKNVFLWNGGGVARKLPEAWFATFIDAYWGKRRVLEVYLNVAEWGDGVFGAEAAAQVRFGKPAADLTRREAALLAAVLPSPHVWRADRPGPYVLQRTETLLARMRDVERDGLATCAL